MIQNLLQFNYVVSLLSAILSFRQISRVGQENYDRLGVAINMACVSDGDVSNFLRITWALGLQLIAYLMSRTWSFLVATDVSTDDLEKSHLDVRI